MKKFPYAAQEYAEDILILTSNSIINYAKRTAILVIEK